MESENTNMAKLTKEQGVLMASLKKAWTGFKLAKVKNNRGKMEKYAKIINDIQDDLGFPLTQFKL